uniref:(California timema) hypothetical protein n=1 Tax=Timema californicum TaxID=61474 RepID=A0A7R9JKE3_TIMCA|nr:unnamed protein product [Timema californicum]
MSMLCNSFIHIYIFIENIARDWIACDKIRV